MSSDAKLLDTSSGEIDLDSLYDTRFASAAERQSKDALWAVLCHDFLQRYVPRDAVVMDIGAGFGEFLRHIQCGRRIAVDTVPMARRVLPPGSIEVIAPSHLIGEHVAAGSVDVVFCSNFFEHLPDKTAFLATLRAIRRVLRPGGRLLVLQPNIRVIGGRYWDFVDHHLPLTDRTLVEASVMCGFTIEEVVPRFLPYTTRSRIPQSPWLLRLYLRCRPAWRAFGGQAWLVARTPRDPVGP